MNRLYTLFAAQICLALSASAQTPFPATDSLNINKINAAVLVHGDMWWNADHANYATTSFFPNGTRKSIGGYGNALWMSGFDGAGQLHVAAQTYRQDGNDYWPGPLDAGGSLSYATSRDWAKVWKVNRSEIQHFLATMGHTPANTAPSILTWPGKGNTHARGNDGVPLTVSTDMAPFTDVNGNGIYEPLSGDFPDVKGDQALWWVFSDNGPTHDQSDGMPLKAEVHAMSYAYSRGTLIDNVIYYDYHIINKSTNNYPNFRAAMYNNIDLGNFNDDYIGFDSSFRLSIVYNGVADDGSLSGWPAGSYGTSVPIVGVTIVAAPGDAGGTYIPAGNFVYHTGSPSVIGVPTADYEYNNYIHGKKRDGSFYTDDYGNPVNYVYIGNPSIPGGWSECWANNAPEDKGTILSSRDFALPAGGSQRIVYALVVTDTGQGQACGSPTLSFNGIKTVADTAWKVYKNPPPLKPVMVNEALSLKAYLYPNPANNILHIELNKSSGEEHISVHNPLGQLMEVPVTRTNTELVLDISRLAVGVYYVQCTNDGTSSTAAFTKY
ncbi:MAG: T9SS type A sorting domain-containing protein [Bacteroidota bacterium]